MSDLQFRVQFAETDQEYELPEDSTLADLGIYVGNDCLTQHPTEGRRARVGQRTFSRTVHGPVIGLADWFIDNWSSILWETQTPFRRSGLNRLSKSLPSVPGVKEVEKEWNGYIVTHEDVEDEGYYVDQDESTELQLQKLADWQRRHLLGHATSDLAIPSIVIVPDERDILLSVDRASPSSDVVFFGPDRRQRTLTEYLIPRSSFSSSVKGFIGQVIEHIRRTGKFNRWAEWVSDRWEAAQDRERDPHKRLETMVGDVSARRIEEIERSEPVLASGLRQILLDCPLIEHGTDFEPLEDLIRQCLVRDKSRASGGRARAWQNLKLSKIRQDEPDFIQGYQLAKAARRRLHLGNAPIEDVAEILTRLDVNLETGRSTQLFRAAAFAVEGRNAHIIPSKSSRGVKRVRSENFAVASALGRLLWDASSSDKGLICVAQGDYSRSTESPRANAFAAEFLLPSEVARGFSPGTSRFYEMAAQYGISDLAAEWHALNATQHSV